MDWNFWREPTEERMLVFSEDVLGFWGSNHPKPWMTSPIPKILTPLPIPLTSLRHPIHIHQSQRMSRTPRATWSEDSLLTVKPPLHTAPLRLNIVLVLSKPTGKGGKDLE